MSAPPIVPSPFVADVNDCMRLLQLSGRQIGFVFGTSSAVISQWARGATTPMVSMRWVFARLAMRLRAASPEQLAAWSAELMELATEDGGAFDLVLELAGGARTLRPESKGEPREVRPGWVTKKTRRPIWDAGLQAYRGAEGGRRVAPLVVTLRRVSGVR